MTEYLQQHLRFVCFPVEDKAARLTWESRIISTVSWCEECGPSPGWLGRHAPNAKIRESGLWLVNELHKEPLTVDEYGELSRLSGAPRE